MALITTIAPDKAEGIIKEGYEMFMKNIGTIPKPMQMLSASPGLFEMQLQRIRYMGKHPKLSFPLLAHIRYLAACTLQYPYCTDFNGNLLKKLGYDEESIAAIKNDPEQSLLEENEKAMLSFVIRAMRQPGSITAGDINHLKELGWEERDMLDALSQGVSMIDHSIMMQVFQIDQSCLIG